MKVGDVVRLNEKGLRELAEYHGFPGNANLTVSAVYGNGSVTTNEFGWLDNSWITTDPAPAPALAESCLTRAQAIVDGPRRASYGHPKENHGRTARMWSAYLNVPITERQVCMLNILQKVSRDAHASKEDNLDDIAGWARNAEIVTNE